MAIGVAQIADRQRHRLALAGDATHLDHTLGGLRTVGAGVHGQGAAEAARNTVVEGKAGEAEVQRLGGQELVGDGGAGPQAGRRQRLGAAEAAHRQADHHAGNAAIADQEVGAEADDGDWHVGGRELQERLEVGLVGRLEQDFRRSAHAEPHEVLQRPVVLDRATDMRGVAKAVAQRSRHD